MNWKGREHGVIIFPAIDLQGGACVRLLRGDFGTAERVAQRPLAAAAAFHRDGAEWLHMVDLDGARTGRRVNRAAIASVAKESGLKVELGGGIRSMETVEEAFADGVSRIILGSAALKNPDFLKAAVASYGNKIVVGIDAKDGFVATEGWVEGSDVRFTDFARRMETIGVKTIIFTDISCDGTLAGPDFAQLAELQAAVSCDIVASGGIRNIVHIRKLAQMGLYGVICGKSLYSGTLSLRDAIREGRS